MKNTSVRRFLSVIVPLTALLQLNASNSNIPNEMIGDWEGDTQVIVLWCNQKIIPVSLSLSEDGSIDGKIGDADLRNANLKKKRNWFGSKNDKRTKYMVKGDLEGSIVEAEDISRPKVFIHLRIENNKLSGSLATSGSKIGGKENMILTTTSLKLSRKITPDKA